MLLEMNNTRLDRKIFIIHDLENGFLPTYLPLCTIIFQYSYKQSRRSKNKDSSMGMLDYGADKYGKSFIKDVRAVNSVLYMFLPFPIFWALFDQQGSLWTFQARRMKATIGDSTYFYPDQMQIANPVMILLFIPLFEYGVYPVFAKFGMLTKPLQRVVTGGTLAGVSFIVSGLLELLLEVLWYIQGVTTNFAGHLFL